MQNVFQFQKFYKFAAQKFKQAILAQLVEQLTRNEQVAGSSPVDGSHKIKADVFLNHSCLFKTYIIITSATAKVLPPTKIISGAS